MTRIAALDKTAIPLVAELMARIKPEFWSVEGAMAQLRGGIGWYLESDEYTPSGWLLCQRYVSYRTVEIETLGYDDHGTLAIGPPLDGLAERCELWSRDQGAKNVRFIIGSRGLSLHQQPLGSAWEALQTLHAIDRPDYDWFLTRDYAPSGVLPDIYGNGYHGVMLIKRL